jgi:hypothetical protein
MSEGWIATQLSLAPKMACSRLKPCRAAQQVAARGGHVPQLGGGAAEDRLGQHRILRSDQGVVGDSAVGRTGLDEDAADAGR